MKKYCYLLILFLSIGCARNVSETNKCCTLQIHELTLSIEINEDQEIRFSQIIPETFFLKTKEGRKQFTVTKDSIIENDYQDRLYPKYYIVDPVDSLIFIGGLNKRAYAFDQKNQKFTSLNSRVITYIHITPNEALLFGYKGLFRYDKKSGSIEKDTLSPLNYFDTRKPQFKDNNLFFEENWSLDLTSNIWSKNKAYDRLEIIREIESKDGIQIFFKNNKYQYKQGERKGNLPNKE